MHKRVPVENGNTGVLPGPGAALYGFRKTRRILDRSEFLELSRQGKKFQDNYFIVLCLPGKFAWTRMGVTVSRRVGNAVTRNRVKRLVREWFRHSRFSGNWDVTIIAKKSAADLPFYAACRSLDNVFAKIGGC